jgi:hypothetical protein
MKSSLLLLCSLLFLNTISTVGIAQWKGRQAPQYLAEEIFRLSKDCYYFSEYLLIKQNKQYYVVASFLNREAIGTHTNDRGFAKPVSPCGKRLQQVRLYRWVNDKKAVFKDSLFIDKFAIALGKASDFDQSGTTKLIINHLCNPPQGDMTPLLCYSFSIYEITRQEKLRNVLIVGNVPERYINGEPQGYALEPVVTDNFDKTPYPECLAIDDFFEGDMAFRSDDIPKVTLIYTWDNAAKMFKHHSDRFIQRFSLPASLDSIPDNIHLVTFMENAMSVAAIGKHTEALKYIDAGLTQERVEHWKMKDPQRAKHIQIEALRSKLLACIFRYKTAP